MAPPARPPRRASFGPARPLVRVGLVLLGGAAFAGLGWIGWAGESHGTVVSADAGIPIRRGTNALWVAAGLAPQAPTLAESLPRIEGGLRFRFGPLDGVGERRVRAFGLPARRGRPVEPPEAGVDAYEPDPVVPALDQVRVRWQDDARAPTRYVLDVVGHDGGRVVYARIDPEPTLGATWLATAARRTTPGIPLPALDRFALPVVDLVRIARGASPAVPAWRLDGEGGRPAATPDLHEADGIAKVPPLPRYVVDGPFLLARIPRGATTPDLLAWFGNADALVPAR
jgi:hypothetical protein